MSALGRPALDRRQVLQRRIRWFVAVSFFALAAYVAVESGRSLITGPHRQHRRPRIDAGLDRLVVEIDVCKYRRVSTSLSLGPLEAVTGCAPLVGGSLSQDQADRLVPLLKALADPVRLRLMSLVASHVGGEACVCDLSTAFDLSQPTISHHLKVLHDAGLLERSKRGVWVYYRARREVLSGLSALLGQPALGAETVTGRDCG